MKLLKMMRRNKMMRIVKITSKRKEHVNNEPDKNKN